MSWILHAYTKNNKKIRIIKIWCKLAYKYYVKINNNHMSDVSTYKKYLNEIIQPKDITNPIDL